MVRTVVQRSKNQYCGIKFYELKQRCFSSRILFLSATLLYCNPVFWSCVQARDFGIHGKVAPIEEVDPLQIIHQKLKAIEERGELERHNLELQKKTRASIERPKPVEGISKTTQARVFYYDPTYLVQEDIKDHQGHVIHAKGTRINPLETVSLSQDLLFFDGDDEGQVVLAKEKQKENPLKLILIKGAPLALSEELKLPVYFDQGGLLTKKLGIHHVPALVLQEEKQLRIEEILLSSLKSESKEGKNK